MSNLLFTLMNAPRIVRRLTALAFLLIVAIIPISFATVVALNISDLSQDVENQRLSLGHLTAFISNAAKAASNVPVSADSSVGELFLVGATPSIAQANLQTLVTGILKQENVEVASAGDLPIEENGRLHVIGVRLSLQGNLAAVHAAIRQIERTTPPLVIREATIRNVTPIQSSVLTGPIQLSAELAVYGSLSPATSLNEGVPK